jgi:hypothetical protein
MTRGYDPGKGDTVAYRDIGGKTRDAVVEGAGADTDELNLRVPHAGTLGATQHLEDIPKLTSREETGVWTW